MARIKNIEAFCGFCNTTTKMELSGIATLSTDGRKWAKCKKCKQTTIVQIDDTPKSRKKPSDEEFSLENATKYSPQSSYTIGDNIYHERWDDFGVVLAKEKLSNGTNSILVKFQKSGPKKLIETITLTPMEAR